MVGIGSNGREGWLLILLASVTVVLAVASLAIGPAQIAPWTAANALVTDLGSASIIVREIRLPRTLLAILIGGTLGVIGAALQGLLRNPLADASVFGAPQAAALGAVLVLYFGVAGALSWALPLAARRTRRRRQAGSAIDLEGRRRSCRACRRSGSPGACAAGGSRAR